MAFRYDHALVNDSAFELTPEGYLNAEVPIARAGVFPYKQPGNKVRYEAKLPEELFSSSTIASANRKPLTSGHPSELVDATNIKKYQVGWTDSDAREVDGALVVGVTVTDPQIIDEIQTGIRKEISIGFVTDEQNVRGVFDGAEYETVQKDMRINHVAIVARGRAGSTISFKADSAEMVVEDNAEQKNGGKTMKIRLDGQDVDLEEAQVQSTITDLETKAATATAEMETVQAKADAAEAKVATLEENMKGMVKADSIDELADQRAKFKESAKKVLGDSFDFVGKSDKDVKVAAITKANPNLKLDSKSDAYVNAYYDIVVDAADEGFIAGINTRGDSADDDKKEVEELRNKRMNMNKKGE
ncbi:DUF2213 domain-containing protein [Periweissella cryptocerci]|uniref:DUF2213 domain-containing protein n=1 Tax=Periweissella cryptocerci TaxID=2506420 RepID=A0A4P6YWT8_9LACO|nr:DUF2213 domain-containing protein [Periweissella cryptocerci]QBO37271.1 DUF2213 domain-containing protein [Periweissella cryptocerci]